MSKIALLHATEAKKKTTIRKIVEASSPVPTYFLLLILSSIIVTIGLALNNAAIVIGGMLVSPLLSPLLSFAMGIVISDMKLLYRSTYVIAKSLGLVVIISFLIALLGDFEVGVEIISRTEPSLLYFYVAVASGVAAAYSYIREEFEERIVGVAVAIALLPPLSVMGIGIALFDSAIIIGSFELFLVNLFGILLSAITVFSLFRFYTVEKEVEEQLQHEAKVIAEYEKEKEDFKEQMTSSLIQSADTMKKKE